MGSGTDGKQNTGYAPEQEGDRKRDIEGRRQRGQRKKIKINIEFKGQCWHTFFVIRKCAAVHVGVCVHSI